METREFNAKMYTLRAMGVVQEYTTGEFKFINLGFKDRVFNTIVDWIKTGYNDSPTTDLAFLYFIFRNYDMQEILNSKDLMRYIFYLSKIEVYSSEILKYIQKPEIRKQLDIFEILER